MSGSYRRKIVTADRLAFFGVVGVLIILAAGWFSQPPQILPSVEIPESQESASTGTQGSRSVTCHANCQVHFGALVTDNQNADSADGETDNEKYSANSISIADFSQQRRMAHWTIVVAFLTAYGALLLVGTLFEAFQGSEAAKVAADAAKLQAQAAINAGRAFLTPLDPELRSMPVQNDAKDLSTWMGFRARVMNRGMGPGFLQYIATGHSVMVLKEAPKGTENLERGDPLGRVLIGEGGDWGVEETPLTAIKITDEEIELLKEGWHYLHIFGYFEYSDLFGVLRRTGFHYSYLPKERVLLIERGHDLWYDIVVQENDGD